MQIDNFLSFAPSVTILLFGKIVTINFGLLRKYSIPEPVVGGLLCTAIYAVSGMQLVFDLGMRDFLLLLFFAGIGLKADARSLLAGGRSPAVLLAPAFVSCLMAGVLIHNLMPLAIGATLQRLWPGVEDGLALVSDLALGPHDGAYEPATLAT